MYGANKSSVSQNVNACVGIVKGDSAQRAAAGRDALTNLPNRYRFEEVKRLRNVSISMGYAYAEAIRATTFKALLDEADRRMYAQKALVHGRQ